MRKLLILSNISVSSMMMAFKSKHVGVKYIIVELCICWYSKDL
jgi:hypothetical protein